jgi:uncharacterized protein DUF6600
MRGRGPRWRIDMTSRTLIATLLITITPGVAAFADPPERVARISFLGGTASFRPAAAIDWSPAVLNYPLTVGDHVWTDRAGRLELTMGATAFDLDAMTAASLLNLDHHIVQFRVAQGTTIARVRELAPDESLEIDTPNGAITLLRPGIYRIDVAPAGDATSVTVRRGDADVAAGPSAFPVHAGQTVTVSGSDAASHAIVATPPLDEFDDWALVRDRRVDTVAAVRYVPRAMVGYEDLDDFGAWRVVAEYGAVWVPNVRPGWAPYRFGHWAWVDPWGWTWIDDAPWGFAPFHYGRWAYVGAGWVWVPGAIVARPVYAPALVAFVGGSNWRVGVNLSAPIGWFPLGPREVFVPAYGVSPAYVTAMNRPHVAVTTVNVNVTNITYVNRTVPGAVTVVSRETFTQARPVAAAAVAVTPQAVSTAVVVGHAAPREVAPIAVARAAAAVAPPAAVASRAVVVRTPPPAAIAPTVVRRAAAAAPAPAAPAVRTAPASAATSTPAPPAQPVPPPAAVMRVAPDRANADLAARHAREQADIEARHAAERAELRARHDVEAVRAADARGQADMRAKHAREQAELDARQKREHDQLQKRQESERRRQ